MGPASFRDFEGTRFSRITGASPKRED